MDEPPTSLDDLELRGVGSEREAIFQLKSSEPATKRNWNEFVVCRLFVLDRVVVVAEA
jgi:hypothetical protein